MNPAIWTTHTGYLPNAPKIAVLGAAHKPGTPFVVRRCDAYPPEGTPIVLRGTLASHADPWDAATVADFSALRDRGFYQVAVGDYGAGVPVGAPDCSFPFLISDDVHVKTMRMAFEYFGYQRCGAAVPGYHPICHLDDAVFRDSGAYCDTVGGWHDAGDVRKWLHHTQMYIFALLEFDERVKPQWRHLGKPWSDVLEEARWGNDYHIKMVDPQSGEVFHDVAGGINGDNCDCRWTDNQVGTGDERHISRVRGGLAHQWWCVVTMVKMSRAFSHLDPQYARTCFQTGMRALSRTSAEPSGKLRDDTLGLLAWRELFRATGDARHRESACRFADSVLGCQSHTHEHGQHELRGYFYSASDHVSFHRESSCPGMPLYALAALAEDMRGESRGRRMADAVRLAVDEYLAPIASRSAFGLIPFGLYTRPLANGAVARELHGELRYRYFNWPEEPADRRRLTDGEIFQHGLTSNQLGYASALMYAERLLGDNTSRNLAFRQLEWVMGANPHAACLMTGGGVNTPYPYAPFVGIIPGGIQNGFIGNESDTPFVHPGNTVDWNTTEYWGTHNAHYLMTLALLYEGTGVLV